jgi:hypothetical protein
MNLPLAALGLQMNVFERGAAGIPTTTLAAALQERIDSCEFSSADQFGFETLTVSFTTTRDEALDWLANGLMRSCELSGPDTEDCWEGFLETIDAQFGSHQRSVSVRDMANRIRVRYQTTLGTQGARPTSSTFFEDAVSYGLYGKKDLALSIGNTSDGTEVDDYGNAQLARLSTPKAAPSSEVRTGDLGEVRLTLHFAGWYATTEWTLLGNTSTTKTTTTTQLGTLLTNLAAVNAFISTATTHITASGVTATEFVEADSTYRSKIETLMARGNGTQPYAYGVYESREFYAAAWAGATPATITYQVFLEEALVLDSTGGAVAFWNVRPNAMLEVVDLLDIAPVSTQPDAAARFYVARVTCHIDQGSISVRFEPSEGRDLEAIMITKYL